MWNIAVILLYDYKKRFLLQHRTDDAPASPGKYGFFGGSTKAGETPELGVKRECYEELEYELENPRLFLSTIVDDEYGRRKVYVFLEKYNPDKKLVLHEGQGMKWVARSEMGNLDLVEYQIDILKNMYNKI